MGAAAGADKASALEADAGLGHLFGGELCPQLPTESGPVEQPVRMLVVDAAAHDQYLHFYSV